MNCRVLVLGGNGFIGSHLVEALVSSGVRVRVFGRAGRTHIQAIKNVEYCFGNFADATSVAELLVDIDIVVHLISTSVPTTANLDPLADITGNLLPSVRLLQQMRDMGLSRMIFLSSGGTVYGNVKSVPIPEDHERNPISSYGIVKVAIENYIMMFCAQYGLEPLILRASNPYGPRQGHLGVQGVISTFFQRIIDGDEITIWGDGSTVRDYIYISDLVSFIVKGIDNDLQGIYNVGSGQGVPLREVLRLIEEVAGVSAKVKHLPPRGFDVPKVVLDISKALGALEWVPLVSLREGCERYWKWAQRSLSN